MFLRTIASQSLGGHFKLARAVAKGHEAQHPEKDTNGLGTDILDGANIDGLAIIAKPVAEVDL